MIGITNFLHNILYTAGTVERPPAISGDYYLCFAMSHHLCFWVPDKPAAWKEPRSHHTKPAINQKVLPALADCKKGRKGALAWLSTSDERVGCVPPSAGGCPILQLMVVPEEVAVLRSPGLLQRLFPSLHPFLLPPFLPILGPFPGPSLVLVMLPSRICCDDICRNTPLCS